MGLFSNLRRGAVQNPDVATAKAVLVPSLLVMASDGRIEESEKYELVNAMTFNALFQRVGPEPINRVVGELLAELGRPGGIEALVALMDPLSPTLRETAICMAVRMAAADGHLDEIEHKTLVALAMRLGVSPEQYNKMVEIVVILQRAA
ncbi:MAG: tellurite resistance TerB family protein [Pseudomonadota bacterium]